MVEDQALNAVFHALADPTRRAMLKSLSSGERKVTELAAPFAISLAAASKHIQVLERAGLVNRTVQGRTHLCRIDARPMHAGLEWMRHYEKFWSERLDVLEHLLKAEDAGKPARAGGTDDAPLSRRSGTAANDGGRK
jgi:DNA-binding transcriptional ArsR family regulator